MPPHRRTGRFEGADNERKRPWPKDGTNDIRKRRRNLKVRRRARTARAEASRRLLRTTAKNDRRFPSTGDSSDTRRDSQRLAAIGTYLAPGGHLSDA